jgi:hypothetical protein
MKLKTFQAPGVWAEGRVGWGRVGQLGVPSGGIGRAREVRWTEGGSPSGSRRRGLRHAAAAARQAAAPTPSPHHECGHGVGVGLLGRCRAIHGGREGYGEGVGAVGPEQALHRKHPVPAGAVAVVPAAAAWARAVGGANEGGGSGGGGGGGGAESAAQLSAAGASAPSAHLWELSTAPTACPLRATLATVSTPPSRSTTAAASRRAAGTAAAGHSAT